MAKRKKDEAAVPRRRTQTRGRLIDAGLGLLAETAIDALSIDEIVAAAGTAKGSFYNHFADKAAFAEAVSAHVRNMIEARIRAGNAGITDPAERMARAMCVSWNFALTHSIEAAIMVRSHAPETRISHALNTGLKRDLEQGLATGRLFAVTADSAALFVLGVNFITMMRIVSEGSGTRSVKAIARQSGLHLLLGLGLSRTEAQALASSATEALVTGREHSSFQETET